MADSLRSAQPAGPTTPEALPQQDHRNQDHQDRAVPGMADSFPTTQPAGPTTPEAFIADRQHFWGRFTRFIVTIMITVAIVLGLMAVFLV